MSEDDEAVIVSPAGYTIYLERGIHERGVGVECNQCGEWFWSIRRAWQHADDAKRRCKAMRTTRIKLAEVTWRNQMMSERRRNARRKRA